MTTAPNTTYDYVVVGAGTAGCVVAARLSEDRNVRVLLLEAGGDDMHPYLRVPIGVGKLHAGRLFDWGYDTIAEAGMANREMMTLRGKVLGGSSSINMMAYTRGNPLDYDRWERMGATGWGWKNVLPYFKRVETWEGGETILRGGSGPVHVKAAKPIDPIDDALLAAALACGYPLSDDYNAQTVGFGRTQFSIRNGRRHSASQAYLRPVRRRRNLTIATNAHALRVIVEGNVARGVAYTQKGTTAVAHASREVILCGGSLNTPQLLMLSGIGPADHLREVGIEPIVSLPVGDNLMDHLKGVLLWKRRGKMGSLQRMLRWDRVSLAFARAYLFGKGPAAEMPIGVQGYVRSRPELEVPDVEFMLRLARNGAQPWFPFVAKREVDVFGLDPVLLHPRSRGTIRLRSADPTAPIRIHYNYLSDPEDIATFRHGFRMAREIGNQTALDAFRDVEVAPGPQVTSDADIDAHLRATSSTVSHPVSTCRMGTDDDAVLDPQLRVRGIEALRVVDASAFPDLPSAHTNAAVYMLAERASDLIRGKIA